MNILHTSDWHLGATNGELSLKEDQENFINEICRVVKEENIKVVIIAGDVYDRSLAGADAIKLYDMAMTRLCKELKVKVIIIAGNHDGVSHLSSCSELLEQTGLHICGALAREPRIVSIDDVDFYMMPWFTTDKVKSLFPEKLEDIKCMTDAYQIVCDKSRETFASGRKHIAISHAFITDSETSTSDKAAEIGTATQVSANVFDGFDYVALGHIHKPQDVNDHVRYSGTPMIYSFGKEEKQEKSVTVIDTDTMVRRTVKLNPLNKWTTLTDTLDNLKEANFSKEILDGYVRLKVTDSFVGYENTAILKSIYSKLVDISGRGFSNDDASTHMTIEEFQAMETNPVEIFKRYCMDSGLAEVDEHLVELFVEAMSEEEK